MSKRKEKKMSFWNKLGFVSTDNILSFLPPDEQSRMSVMNHETARYNSLRKFPPRVVYFSDYVNKDDLTSFSERRLTYFVPRKVMEDGTPYSRLRMHEYAEFLRGVPSFSFVFGYGVWLINTLTTVPFPQYNFPEMSTEERAAVDPDSSGAKPTFLLVGLDHFAPEMGVARLQQAYLAFGHVGNIALRSNSMCFNELLGIAMAVPFKTMIYDMEVNAEIKSTYIAISEIDPIEGKMSLNVSFETEVFVPDSVKIVRLSSDMNGDNGLVPLESLSLPEDATLEIEDGLEIITLDERPATSNLDEN
jgi:hypothetical protein